MKFIHLSDVHIGKHLNEFPLLDDQRHILGRVLEIADERQVDAVVVAGDLYDKTSPSAEAVALVDWFLTEIARRELSCFIVPGNHDSAERIGYAGSLLARQGVHVPPPFDGTMACRTLHDEHGAVHFWLLPFVKPAHVRPFYPEAKIERDYTTAVRTVIEAAPVDPQQRNVIVAHQFVTAGGTAPERTDSELSLGTLDNVDASVFDAFDYVALGHVHRAQRVGRDEVRYAGSPLKYSLSELRGTKTVPLVTLGAKGDVAFELLPLEPLHDLRRIKGPLEQLVDPANTACQDCQDYVHAVLTDEQPPLDALARLRAIFPRTIAIDYDNARSRAHGVHGSAASPEVESLPPDRLFAAFYELQNGAPLNERQQRIVEAALEQSEVAR